MQLYLVNQASLAPTLRVGVTLAITPMTVFIKKQGTEPIEQVFVVFRFAT